MNDELDLLQQAAQEITILRNQNQLMNARLEMFDTMITVLNTQPATKSQGMSPDIVYQINKLIEERKAQPVEEKKEAAK